MIDVNSTILELTEIEWKIIERFVKGLWFVQYNIYNTIKDNIAKGDALTQWLMSTLSF